MTFKTWAKILYRAWVKKGKEDGTKFAGGLEWVEGTSIVRCSNNGGEQVKREELPIYNSKGQIIIRSLDKYRELLLKEEKKDLDFSELNMRGEDIQQLDLSNLGLNINLQDIFHPCLGSAKYYNNILQPIFHDGDDFVELSKSDLRGNNISGELCNFEIKGQTTCTFIYTEDTFDEEYKKSHSKYFLGVNAPSELKEKYYRPLIKTEMVSVPFYEDRVEEKTVYYRQELTFEEYLKYYKFLHGKYIDRFRIKQQEYGKIKFVEALGLDMAKAELEMLLSLNINMDLMESLGNMSLKEIKVAFSGKRNTQLTEVLGKVDEAINSSGRTYKKK